MTNPWINDDGLRVRFGNVLSKQAKVGGPRTSGTRKELRVILDTNEAPLNSTTVDFLGEPTAALPEGAYIESALLVVTTAFDSAGDAATLSIGTAQQDATTIDADGFDVAIAETALDTAGKEVALDGAHVGEILTSAFPHYLTATVGTEAFTAGEGYIDIFYQIPPVIGAS